MAAHRSAPSEVPHLGSPSTTSTRYTGSPSGTAAIRTRNLGKRYGDRWALRDLDLVVEPGEVFGFLGPNGAGKSTTIRLLMGLARPTVGEAWLAGHRAVDVPRAHREVAYVPADVALWPHLTGAEVLELVAHLGPEPDRDYRTRLVERFELDLDRRAGTYSTGNRQKVALVAAFATRAPVLILDEPTSGLDPLMEQGFQISIAEARERGQTVFLSSHQLAEVEAVCDRVGILRAGELVEVAELAELRRLRRVEIEARLGRPGVELDTLRALPGVAEVRVLGTDHLLLQMGGELGPALRLIADAEPATLTVREASLEEIFLEYYGNRP